MYNFTTPVIDPGSELAEALDAILRDLAQVVEYEHVRILLLPSVLDVRGGSDIDVEDYQLITVRDLGPLTPLLAPTAPLSLDKYPLNRLLMTMQKPIVIADTRYSDLWVKTTAHQNVRAWIGAPLVVKGESIGVLTLHSSQPMKYTERDGLVVFAFASQTAEAIHKVRLLDRAQNRLHAMMSLYDASLEVIGQTQNPAALLRTLVRRAVELLGAEAGAIYLVEPDRTLLKIAITYGFADEYIGATLPVTEGLGGRVYQSAESLIVDDYRRWSGRAAQYNTEPRFSAIMGLPLRWKDDVLGVLEILANSETRRFNSQDRWLGELFANQVAIALGNARLAEHGRRYQAELEAARDISRQLNTTPDLTQVLDTICAHALTLFSAEQVQLQVWDDASGAFTSSVGRGRSGADEPIETTPAFANFFQQVRESGQPIIIGDIRAHELTSPPESATLWSSATDNRSLAALPLQRLERSLGVLSVTFDTIHHFSEDELRLLGLLADQAALAIDCARLQPDPISAQVDLADLPTATD